MAAACCCPRVEPVPIEAKRDIQPLAEPTAPASVVADAVTAIRAKLTAVAGSDSLA